MDRIVDVLLLLLVLGVVAFVSLLLSTPFGAIAIWHYAKTRRYLHLRALLTSLLNGLGQGLLLGVGGFALGASVPGEDAGTAAVFLGAVGLVVAGSAAFVLSYLLIVVGCKMVGRRSQQPRHV